MMQTKYFKLLITLICTIFMASSMIGCATLTTGSSQAITINTNPTGANCTLNREGKSIAIINPTPGSITVDKDKDAITVLCHKDGYQDSADIMPSTIQGMTFGNILIGGLIGLGVDMISGSINKYEPMLVINLIPDKFDSITERDDFFNGMKEAYLSESSKNIARLAGRCDMIAAEKENEKQACEKQVQSAEKAREKRLEDIELKRKLAKFDAENNSNLAQSVYSDSPSGISNQYDVQEITKVNEQESDINDKNEDSSLIASKNESVTTVDSESETLIEKQSDKHHADTLIASALSERWVKVGINESGFNFYYDSETLVISDEEIAKVWIKTINKENKYLDLVEIDCIQDKFHMLQEKYASNSIFSEYTQEWKLILPESVPELIHNSLCHKEIAKVKLNTINSVD